MRFWTRLLAVPMLVFVCAASTEAKDFIQFSGRYPHLAMFNKNNECGTGAVVPWAGKLWVVTYAPHHPRGGDDKLVLCEVLNTDMTPHETNTRVKAVEALEKYGDQDPWFGMEQEYTFYKDGRPHGWPI